MTPHDWFVEHRSAYAVGALEPDEERVFREHLKGCAECRGRTEAIARDLGWLPMGVTPAAPRPGLVRRLAERSLGRPAPRHGWRAAAALAASVIIAAGSLAWARASVRQVRAEAAVVRRDLEHSLAMARDTLSLIRSADRVRHAAISLGRQRGGMVLFADDRRHLWNVVIYGVRPPAAGEVLQFWFITERDMVRGVQIRFPRAGPAFLTMGMPPAGGRVRGAALTLESASLQASGPSGPVLVHLML